MCLCGNHAMVAGHFLHVATNKQTNKDIKTKNYTFDIHAPSFLSHRSLGVMHHIVLGILGFKVHAVGGGGGDKILRN